jgi:hypothetical protein
LYEYNIHTKWNCCMKHEFYLLNDVFYIKQQNVNLISRIALYPRFKYCISHLFTNNFSFFSFLWNQHILIKPTKGLPCVQPSWTTSFNIPCNWQKSCKVQHAKVIIKVRSTRALNFLRILHQFLKVPNAFSIKTRPLFINWSNQIWCTKSLFWGL